jgi:hypothetical protein
VIVAIARYAPGTRWGPPASMRNDQLHIGPPQPAAAGGALRVEAGSSSFEEASQQTTYRQLLEDVGQHISGVANQPRGEGWLDGAIFGAEAFVTIEPWARSQPGGGFWCFA